MTIKNIVLDFGHGGIDSNGNYTTAPSKMYTHSSGEVAYEGQLNRAIGAFLMGYLLNEKDLNIITTVSPSDPTDVSLQERVRITNKLYPRQTLFISIHCNAGKGDGFEIFTSKGLTASDALAEKIADSVEHLYTNLCMKLRYDLSDGDKDKESDFYVLKNTLCPAVLIECGFFDNYSNYKHLRDPHFQKKVAEGIYNGIKNYIKEKN